MGRRGDVTEMMFAVIALHLLVIATDLFVQTIINHCRLCMSISSCMRVLCKSFVYRIK